MNIKGLLKEAEKNTSIPKQKRFSLEFSPPKKLPKTQVNPDAIRALLEKKERDRRDERKNLITRAVESTKRDDVNYKDRHGLRKAEQERTEKCKKQWQKVQKDRREFIEHMNKSADRRDKSRDKPRDANEVLASVKDKEQDKNKRKRKYEPYTGSNEPTKKVKLTPIAAPRVTDINELMKMAQKNAEEKTFGACVNPMRELEKKSAPVEERLLTQAEKKKLEEQEAFSKRRDFSSIPRIPKIGQNSDKSNKHKSKHEKDSKTESSKEKEKEKEKDRSVSKKKTPTTPSSYQGSSSTSSKDKHEKHKDKKHSSEKEKTRSSHNGSHASKSNGSSKVSAAQTSSARKPTPVASMPNGNLGKAQNGNVAAQSMSSAAKDKLREEMAKKLAQLQKERQAEEEEERRKRVQAKKARLAEEQELKKKLRALQQNRSRLDSEDEDDDDENDEYDDDFIDDGPLDDPYAKGYSEHIKEIFKYDKTKYRYMDDDDIEESSFTRCMAEEARSSRLGRQEDLEDMRKEAEDMRREAENNSHKNDRSKTLKVLSEKVKQKKKLTLCPV